jgi:hypothetical protein
MGYQNRLQRIWNASYDRHVEDFNQGYSIGYQNRLAYIETSMLGYCINTTFHMFDIYHNHS